MAHSTQITGKMSELKAVQALLAHGWQPALPVVDEAHDIQAWHPEIGGARFQVKTIRKRQDRNGELVLIARKGNGEPYTKDDADYLIGVHNDTVYMMETRGIAEYWATEESADTRWSNLTKEAVS